MGEYDLGFVSDETIFQHVLTTVNKYRFSINLQRFNRNLIDPIKLTFDTNIYGKTINEIIESEILRQIDKSKTNHIGYFHQNIFQYLGSGWEVPETGFDVVNLERNIFVEIKNKHNTMNSSASQKTYMKMQHKILRNSDATCMLVEVIAKNSQNIAWNISLDGEPMSNANIRRVSIDKFYEIVTGDNTAFKKLCEKLPEIISDATHHIQSNLIENTVLAELVDISPNIVQSLFLLSFKKYEGFDDFEVAI